MATTVTLPAAVKEHAYALAKRDGVSMTNIIERVLCAAFGMPVPSYCLPKPNSGQRELPLAKAS
ncbi:hypothetical protein [Pseudonocardia spinosispora]|uniref:hypothetical protein n=1 Tax=Pseudonocardia spinosispora TaxID=103441 RepID=UPI0003F7A74C|nr:hypothetical protein [Pseudonocardia spinosispora]